MNDDNKVNLERIVALHQCMVALWQGWNNLVAIVDASDLWLDYPVEQEMIVALNELNYNLMRIAPLGATDVKGLSGDPSAGQSGASPAP